MCAVCDKVPSSVSVQGLAQLEILCKQLYETTDTAVRHQAEKALVEFTNSPDCLSKCQLLLERGSVSAEGEPAPPPEHLSFTLSVFISSLKCSVKQCHLHPSVVEKSFGTLLRLYCTVILSVAAHPVPEYKNLQGMTFLVLSS